MPVTSRSQVSRAGTTSARCGTATIAPRARSPYRSAPGSSCDPRMTSRHPHSTRPRRPHDDRTETCRDLVDGDRRRDTP
ncbi:hypothetical protein ACFPM0_02370 [Pseudonocardia sulfidoxydans]|uniref:hypothetical protein n=1 Tax=Pseudonocardia sulfidoxydans TaxID=54011 RepID=UPI00361EB898